MLARIHMSDSTPQQAKDRLPPGIELVKADDFEMWLVDIRVLDANPLYRNEIYQLCFKFGDGYPIREPLFPPPPNHPHFP